jgi:hypothetical protein
MYTIYLEEVEKAAGSAIKTALRRALFSLPLQ